MLATVDREFRRKLENRLPSICNPRHNKSDNLLPSTRIAFQNLLRLLIKSELKIESMRQKLNRLSRFSIKNIFERIDKSEKNYLLDSDVNNQFIFLFFIF
jgi:ribose 1,5-bisphosphokinase PhnN